MQNKLLLSIILAAFVLSLNGQRGSLDEDFRFTSNGITQILVTYPLANNKVLVAGNFSNFEGSNYSHLVRLNSNGTVDSSFISIPAELGALQLDLIEANDTIIYLGGQFLNQQGMIQHKLLRLFSNGLVDTTFNLPDTIPSISSGRVSTLRILPNHQIVAAIGTEESFFSNLYRFTEFGELIQTLSINPILFINTIEVLNNSIYVGFGANSSGHALGQPILRKYNFSLEEDLNFAGRNAFSIFNPKSVNSIRACAETNTLYLAGMFNSYQNQAVSPLIRIFESGERDPTFNTPILMPISNSSMPLIDDIKFMEDKIFAYGNFRVIGNQHRIVVKLNTDGSLNNSFLFNFANQELVGLFSNGIFRHNRIAFLTESNKLLFSLNLFKGSSNFNFNLTTVELDGTINFPAFDHAQFQGSRQLNFITHVKNKLIVSGLFKSFGSSLKHSHAVIEENGSISELNFNQFMIPNARSVIKVNELNEIFIGNTALRKVDTLGNILPFTVRPVFPFNSNVNITFDALNRTTVFGSYTSMGPFTNPYINRLLTNGSFDPDFNFTEIPNNTIWDVKYLPDNSILVAGAFTQVGNQDKSYLVKYDYSGELITAFNPGNIADSSGFNNTIRAILPLEYGKILVAGQFTKYGNITQNRIALLNEDGSLDSTFNSGSGFNGMVSNLTLLPDGKIAATGLFTSYQNIPTNRLVVIDNFGNIDTTFQLGLGASQTIFSASVDPQGRLLLGGSFNTFDNRNFPNLVRLNLFNNCPTDAPIVAQNFSLCNFVSLGEIPVFGSDIKWFESSTATEPLSLSTMVEPNATYYITQTINGCESEPIPVQFDLDDLPIELSAEDGVITSNVSVDNALFEWINCDTGIPLPGLNNASIEPLNSGSFKLKVYKNGCVYESACFNFSTVGVNELTTNGLHIFPNPASQQVTLNFSNQVPFEPIELYDITGKLLLSQRAKSLSESLDITQLSTGIYFIRIGNFTQKLIKQ
ncbi:MAG: T9SS type A sorting domain-containing protein [Luteibaculaceae bacterium]